MSDDVRRNILEAAYKRLRERIEAKDVTAEGLKAAAFDALTSAKVQVDLDPMWVAQELDRLRVEPVAEPQPEITDVKE